MKKSLIIVASALVLAVGAASTSRLRYASSVFSGDEVAATSTRNPYEYPPCVRGVREDRCIQLYERGVRRSYAQWLAQHGVSPNRQAAATAPARRAAPVRTARAAARPTPVRTARAAAPARAARIAPAPQRVAARAAPAPRAIPARASVRLNQPVRPRFVPARATVRTVATPPRLQPARPAARPAPRGNGGGSTPGI